MLTDLGSFVIALIAFFLARLPPSRRFPFGWFRAGTCSSYNLSYDPHLPRKTYTYDLLLRPARAPLSTFPLDALSLHTHTLSCAHAALAPLRPHT